MDEASYRQELSARLNALKKQMADGKIKFAAHIADGLRESLMRVRMDSAGLVLMDTVDEKVRSLANIVSHLKYREDTKSIAGLADIQGIYFETIERNFHAFYREMCNASANAHMMATVLSRNQAFLGKIGPQIDEFINSIKDFWRDAGQVVELHTEDLDAMKAVFGGDLFPSYLTNIASSCGLYVDTIVLPCPFIRISPLYSTLTIEQKVYYVFKSALNLLCYKEIALASVTPPIVLVCPDRRLLKSSEDNFLRSLVEKDTAKHVSHIFGCHLDSFQEVLDYVQDLDTPEQVTAAVVDPAYMLFDVDWDGDMPSQIRKAMTEFGVAAEQLSGGKAGRFIAHSVFGRMYQANDLIDRALALRGTPFADAPTSWKYFNWKLEQDNQYAAGNSSGEMVTLHVLHALQYAAERKLCWLGNIPTSSLIDIRKQGAAEEVRSILSKGVKALSDLNPDDFLSSTAHIMRNIDEAFGRHQKTLKDLSAKKLKLFGIDVASCLSVGGISIAAAITANPILGTIAGIAGMAGASTVKDVVKNFRDIKNAEQRAALSPTGIFFRHVQ